MKKSTLLISSLVLSTLLVFGQNTRKVNKPQLDESLNEILIQNTAKTPSGNIRCYTSEMEQLKQAAKLNTESVEQFETWIDQKIKEEAANPSVQKASRNIPVVVHVLYGNATQNISLAQIQSQITALNKDYSATNTDYSSVPSAFNSVKGNMDIQFCLAQTDPNGNPTDGVDRVSIAPATSLSTTTIDATWKPATIWDPTKYLNLWAANISGGILGYAQFPTSSGLSGLTGGATAANTDGVVILYNAFGTTGTLIAQFNKGRTATHEIGHWLGLRHISGDAACGNDFCADTPPQIGGYSSGQNGLNYGCPPYPYAPTGECAGTTAEMTMNYMDYTDDACMYMFTVAQKTRMDAVLANSPRRVSLLTSNVCSMAAITANFTGTPTTINAGQSVTFTDASTSPATLNSWSWSFPGGTPSTSNVQTPPAITYAAAGSYNVTLTVGDNAAGSNSVTKTAYIVVNPTGTVICDSTAAGWDWNTETFVGAYWTQDPAGCNLPLEGYIMGNNCYDDNGWAGRVTYPGAGKELTEVRYVFVQSSGTGAGNLKIWKGNGAGGKPSTVLATFPITTGQFSANLNQFIQVPISPAIDFDVNTTDFYIGNDHAVTPLNGDTLVMGVSTAVTNTCWANESGTGWKDLTAYGILYKPTVVAVVCNKSNGVKSQISDIKEVVVFPNPTSGTIEIMLPKNNATVDVYNMIGEKVVSSSTTSNMMNVDISTQPNGVYFVKVTSNGEVTTKKIMLSK